MKNNIRHIIGYSIGFIIFLLLIPYWQYQLSIKEYSVFGDNLFDPAMLRMILSLPFFIVAVIFAAWSNIFLFKYGEGGPTDIANTAISPRTKKLVISGPYRYSRNPMLLGTVCLYTSIGIFLNSIRALLIPLGLLIFMVIYIKIFEEERLLKDFGNDYINYKKSVPMVFPRIRLKK